MKIAIIQYNAGNVQSVQYALQRLGVESEITSEKETIRRADKVILPGVGYAKPAMQYLKEMELDKIILSLKQPVLGICLGLQLLCSHSEEGDTPCLGVFEAGVKLFPKAGQKSENLKVPQVGWNNIYDCKGELFKGVNENDFVYFLHSYYAVVCNATRAKTDYIVSYSAALQKDNYYAVQFHPEKSGVEGETILKNFINIP